MPSKLYPTGTRMSDSADVLAQASDALTALNAATGTLPAAVITGGDWTTVISSNAAPGTQTTRTALQMFGDDQTAFPGSVYMLRICNSGAGTLTLAAGSGVTLAGTMTVATATFRDFAVAYGGTSFAPTVTITNVGTGTYT